MVHVSATALADSGEREHSGAPRATAFRPRYSFVASMENCDAGPTDFAVQVNDAPAFEAQPPVANRLARRPEPVQPVTLPSVIVSVTFPSVPFHAKVAPGLRATPLSASSTAFGPSHS